MCDNRLLLYDVIKLSVKTDFHSLFTVRKEKERDRRRYRDEKDQVSHPKMNLPTIVSTSMCVAVPCTSNLVKSHVSLTSTCSSHSKATVLVKLIIPVMRNSR